MQVFNKMDVDGSRTIEQKEVLAYWAGKFPVINAQAMFESLDKNGDGQIEVGEWIAFWRAVKGGGHSEEEIELEVSPQPHL